MDPCSALGFSGSAPRTRFDSRSWSTIGAADHSGPVFENGRWCADTIPIVATSIHPEPGAPAVVCVIVHEALFRTAAA